MKKTSVSENSVERQQKKKQQLNKKNNIDTTTVECERKKKYTSEYKETFCPTPIKKKKQLLQKPYI